MDNSWYSTFQKPTRLSSQTKAFFIKCRDEHCEGRRRPNNLVESERRNASEAALKALCIHVYRFFSNKAFDLVSSGKIILGMFKIWA